MSPDTTTVSLNPLRSKKTPKEVVGGGNSVCVGGGGVNLYNFLSHMQGKEYG